MEPSSTAKLNCTALMEIQDDWCGPVSALFVAIKGTVCFITASFIISLLLKRMRMPKRHVLSIVTMAFYITGLLARTFASMQLILPMHKIGYILP